MKKIKFNKGWTKFIIVGVVAYLIFIIAEFPAAVAYQYFVQPLDKKRAVNLQGLSGTLWSGKAAQSRVANITLGQLQWGIQFMPLLMGKLGLDIQLENNRDQVNAELTAGMSGVLEVSNLQGQVPVTTFTPLFYGPPIAVKGQVSADIKHAEIKQGRKIIVDGKATWHNAALTAPTAFEFGNLFAAFRPQPDGTKILLSDQGGPLTLEGTIQIKNSGEYKANIYLGSRGDNADLKNALKMLGRTNPQGKILITRTGKLKNWR